MKNNSSLKLLLINNMHVLIHSFEWEHVLLSYSNWVEPD